METGATTDRLFYNRLDTDTDTRLLGAAATSTSNSQGGTFVSGTNNTTITKGSDGTIYMAISDASDSFVVQCPSANNCGTPGGWSEAGSAFMDLDNDWNILLPLLDGDILLINRDISLDDIRSRVWNGSNWSASWTVVDAAAVENATYDVGMAATVDVTSGDVYLAYAADHDTFTTLDHDIRTAKFTSGSWSGTTALFTNRATIGLTNVAISLDTNTGDVYVGYVIRTTAATATTGNVYYATSTSAMSTWSTEQGPVNAAAGDFRGLDLNLMSDERIYASWYDPAPDDIFGNTVRDIAPVTKVYASGTPVTTINASTSNVFPGTIFVLKETVTSRNVTDIVINETGTVAGNTAIANIKLLYDLDTTAPYNCASESYSGSESQYGLTDTNGFSGANGSASFSGLVNISPTQAMCIYPVLDVLDSALDGDTLSLSIDSPNDDIIVTGGGIVMPNKPVGFVTSSNIANDELTQTHFHWRNDNGSEVGATSASGGIEDTFLTAILPNVPRRIRLGISNEGSQTSQPTSFRLEYAEAAPTCAGATSWTDVGATDDAWNMFNSANLTDGSNTTNISVASGGVTDENTTFLTPNGGQRDTSSQTGALTFTSTNFTELEYSIVASSTASEGTTYCFRVSNAGTPLPVYTQYPSATIAADLGVTATGTHTSSVLAPSTNQHLGGAFVLRENTSSRTITDITITELGTIDASAGLDNIRLRYDLDTTVPYNCASENYAGSEAQYGATDTDGMSGPNGSSTFSGSLVVSTTSTVCLYIVADITDSAQNAETIKMSIASPASEIIVSSGSVSPSTAVSINGTTTVSGSVMTQTGYHWRNNDGGEATSTSATGGSENVVETDHLASTTIRLRLALSNEGAATGSASSYNLEFGPRVTTCSAVSVWTPVGEANDDWNMFNSSFLTHGANTTNIAVANGGVTDPNPTFITSNAGVLETQSTSSVLTIGTSEFVEFEYSLTATNITAYDTTYCFRLTRAGVPLTYTQYAEITTAPKRDFKVQRGTATVTGTSLTLTAGVDYTAPTASTTAFVRITDTHNTGPGRTTAGGGAQNADDITAYISNPANIRTNFTITRPSTATGNTRVNWEIVEFIGDAGTDNEMIVRGVGSVSMALASVTATGTAVATTTDDGDIVVFITGIENRDAARNVYYAGQVSAAWSSTTNQPVFTRGAGGAVVSVSYAVVEYTGINWNIQRSEHTYASTTVTETENITLVNSLSRTFIHTQKRMTAQGNVNNFGHEVWLSSIGAVSYRLEAAATTPGGHTSVAWIIENQQTSNGAMKVQRTNGTTNAGTEPVSLAISIFTPIQSAANASIFANTRVVGANTTFPLPMAGARITSTTTYELWRSEASGDMTYRTEIVEWPVSGLAVRQNYYRLYDDNNALTPTDPWPPGAPDLGENTPVTVLDEPLGEGDVIRLRMSLRVANANLPAGLYSFKLQYGLRGLSCSSVGSWNDLGASGSGEAWRGYAATGTVSGSSLSTNPPTGGDLVLSVSDRAGSLTEEGISVGNPYLVNAGEDVEYDWYIQHNGAIERSTYCFRMVQQDGTTLDGYFNYPQIRTAGFTPNTKNWRYYDDAENETPSSALSAETIAPIEVTNQNVIALRVTVGESKNVTGQNVKFSLQYDESPSFTSPTTLVASSSCTATSTWCYADGGGFDNATITTKVLSDADACTGSVGNGCGSHNSSATYVTGFGHPAGANREYSFYLKPAAPRAGAVYYFRLYEVYEDVPVPIGAGETPPSLVAETPKLTLNISGLEQGTTTAGLTTTVSSTPATIAYGSLPLGTSSIAAHRVTVTTNATEGYRVYSFARQQLLNSYGTSIPPITGSNATPTSWSLGCQASSTGCVGYHTTDATLSGGSTRFAALDTFAALHTNPLEVMYSPIPANESHDILYRVLVREAQPAGDYETEIVYIAIPTY
jgi:hypothetical protein